jgi:CRISPR-associated endoribonuclease Cas6
MSLIAIVLTLRSEKQALLPRDIGRAVYAVALENLARVDADLPQSIHAGDGPKPVTCSGILNGRGNRQGTSISPTEDYYVRITGLNQRASQALDAAFLTQPPTTLTLNGHPFTVTSATCDNTQHPWSGRTTYETLAAQHMLHSDPPPRQVTLSFAAPVAFKSGGIQMPLPLPGLVFGSLVDRWNQFSPVRLSPDVRRFGEEQVAISRFRMHSRPVDQKNGAMRVGGLGRVTYTVLRSDRYWQGVMGLLADFALFSGVGVQTTSGMGQTRRLG